MRRIALAFLIAAGCNPGDFSNIEFWVDSTDPPDNLNSDDYGAAVAFAGTSGSGASIVVLSREPAGLVLLDYNGNGGLDRRLQILSDRTPGLLSLPVRPVVATDPEGFGPEPNVAIAGTNGNMVPYAVLLSADTFDFPDAIQFGDTGGAPSALAIGRTNADADVDAPGNPDLLALVGDTLWLVQDYGDGASDTNVFSCSVPDATNLIVAEVDAGLDEGAEILVAAGGAIRLLRGNQVVAADCTGEAVEVGDGEDDLGQALAVGDFDGNGADDVAIGAPSGNTVYVLPNGEAGDAVAVSGPGGSSSFGEAVAAGDFDRDGNDELVVGDSQFSGEVNGGGVVRIFAPSGGGFDEVAALHDAEPESNQHFGRSVAVARFSGDADILSAGASEEVFTYFRLPIPGNQDVRP